jgi:hypothetical protein
MPELIVVAERHRADVLFVRCVCMLALAALSACATHRSDPPHCKGPFTPINQSSSVASNGSQR